MSAKTRLPQSESELSLSNTLHSMKSISSLRSDSSSSGQLRGSVGTLLSLAPSSTSMFTVPSSSADQHLGEEGGSARKERRPRDEKKQLSGLSLSRPSSIDGEGYTSADHDASDSPSTSSSPSSSGSPDARKVLSPQNTTRPVTLLNRRPLPLLLTVHSRTSSSIEGSNNYNSIIASTTPTATVTPLATPRVTAVRPLPTSMIDVEKQKGQSASHQHGSASSSHGQGHVRWRSPLRVSGRDLELDCEGRVEGTWGAHRSSVDEETPLLVGYGEEETTAPAEFRYGPKTSIGKKKDVAILSATMKMTRRGDLKARIKKELHRAPEYAVIAMKSVPAVLLGCLLNILDGVSCEYQPLDLFQVYSFRFGRFC